MTASHLYQRDGSRNWYVRIDDRAHGKRIERSLFTADRRQAEINAAPIILEHKKAMAERPRLRLAQVWKHAIEPGRSIKETDGTILAASDRTITVIAPDGTVTTRPNGGLEADFVGPWPDASTSQGQAIIHAAFMGDVVKPSKPQRDPDESLLEDYLNKGSLGGRGRGGIKDEYKRKEAFATLAMFKQVTADKDSPTGKPLAKATYADAEKLAASWPGLKGASVQKKLKYLTCAVRRAIETGREGFKPAYDLAAVPFAKAMPSDKDSEQRLPFSDDDMAAIRTNLHKLSGPDQLLVRIMATMGLRPSECFQIVREEPRHKKSGVRYCHIGTKTKSANRYVPFSQDVLDNGLPEKIDGRLFAGDYDGDADGRLGAWLRNDCGITDPNKVVYSFRHTVKAALESEECPRE